MRKRAVTRPAVVAPAAPRPVVVAGALAPGMILVRRDDVGATLTPRTLVAAVRPGEDGRFTVLVLCDRRGVWKAGERRDVPSPLSVDGEWSVWCRDLADLLAGELDDMRRTRDESCAEVGRLVRRVHFLRDAVDIAITCESERAACSFDKDQRSRSDAGVQTLRALAAFMDRGPAELRPMPAKTDGVDK